MATTAAHPPSSLPSWHRPLVGQRRDTETDRTRRLERRIARATENSSSSLQALGRSEVGTRYWIEGSAPARPDVIRWRAKSRFDERPVWIVLPQGPHVTKFANVMRFVQAGKRAAKVRHPNVLRTLEAGILDDGKPYAVVERVPSRTLAALLARGGPLAWPAVRTIALRLCSALEAARRRGVAPRMMDMDTCAIVRGRDASDSTDVRLGELFALDTARPPLADAPAIATMIHALRGGSGQPQRGEGDAAMDLVLLRALGTNGYPEVRALSVALAGIDDGRTRESYGANHAEATGEFVFEI